MTTRWLFKSITKNNISQIRISDADFFQLDSNGTFKYEIAFINKNKTGNWTYKNNILTLNYQNPDTSRNFEVKIISNHELILFENDFSYNFKKE